MTEYIRDLPTNIVSREVLRKDASCKGADLICIGWKIYIQGAKYPAKPLDYYAEDEKTSINLAIIDYKKRHGV